MSVLGTLPTAGWHAKSPARAKRLGKTRRSAEDQSLVVLAPGESDAHPLEAPAHWSMATRVFLVVGSSLFLWGLIGAGIFIFSRR